MVVGGKLLIKAVKLYILCDIDERIYEMSGWLHSVGALFCCEKDNNHFVFTQKQIPPARTLGFYFYAFKIARNAATLLPDTSVNEWTFEYMQSRNRDSQQFV